MRGNSITVELEMPELLVEGQRWEGGVRVVEVRYRCMARGCPRCGRLTSHVHQYHRQYKHHVALGPHPTVLELRKRRFRCDGCRRVFMEPDEVCGVRRRNTIAFRRVLAEGCLKETVKDVASTAGVSEGLVRRALSEMATGMMGRLERPARIVALDGVRMGAKAGMQTVLYLPQERWVLALKAGSTQACAEALLEGLEDGQRVAAVVMDMDEAYRQAVQYSCPQAVIVVDKFHVLSHVLLAMQKVASQVQGQAERSDIPSLRRRRLFTATSRALSLCEREERDRLLEAYPMLGDAWHRVQAFRAIYHQGSREEAAQALETWWAGVQRSGPRAFLGLRHTLTHWREEILNYYEYPITNGFAEGKNNRIKAMIRTAYGYRNMENLRLRILLANRPSTPNREANSPHLLT